MRPGSVLPGLARRAPAQRFRPGSSERGRRDGQQIARACDGVRCDMAMLVMSDVFERTWGSRAGARPADDYWTTLIPAVRSRHPEFRFLAEAYWDLEWALQQQGFDSCYDKKLYDRMEHGDAESIRLHLLADTSYQHGLVRFLENHDEPRAAATFPAEKARAAAVAILTLPGAKLLYEGQLEGRRVRLPVFLGRRPKESPDQDLEAFYRRLLAATRPGVFRNGRVADLRAHRLARQLKLQKYPGLVLGDGRRPLSHSNQLLRGRFPVPRAGSLGRSAREIMEVSGRFVGRCLRAEWRRDG